MLLIGRVRLCVRVWLVFAAIVWHTSCTSSSDSHSATVTGSGIDTGTDTDTDTSPSSRFLLSAHRTVTPTQVDTPPRTQLYTDRGSDNAPTHHLEPTTSSGVPHTPSWTSWLPAPQRRDEQQQPHGGVHASLNLAAVSAPDAGALLQLSSASLSSEQEQALIHRLRHSLKSALQRRQQQQPASPPRPPPVVGSRVGVGDGVIVGSSPSASVGGRDRVVATGGLVSFLQQQQALYHAEQGKRANRAGAHMDMEIDMDANADTEMGTDMDIDMDGEAEADVNNVNQVLPATDQLDELLLQLHLLEQQQKKQQRGGARGGVGVGVDTPFVPVSSFDMSRMRLADRRSASRSRSRSHSGSRSVVGAHAGMLSEAEAEAADANPKLFGSLAGLAGAAAGAGGGAGGGLGALASMAGPMLGAAAGGATPPPPPLTAAGGDPSVGSVSPASPGATVGVGASGSVSSLALSPCMTCVFVLERIKKGKHLLLPAICSEVYDHWKDQQQYATVQHNEQHVHTTHKWPWLYNRDTHADGVHRNLGQTGHLHIHPTRPHHVAPGCRSPSVSCVFLPSFCLSQLSGVCMCMYVCVLLLLCFGVVSRRVEFVECERQQHSLLVIRGLFQI